MIIVYVILLITSKTFCMKKNFLIAMLAFATVCMLTSSTVKKQNPTQTLVQELTDYDRGYNQSYALGQAGNYSLFGSRYNTALQNDRFELAEGMLDGYNAGRAAGPAQSPGQGGGNPTSDGCKIVINDQALTDYLNGLGFGCYVNFN